MCGEGADKALGWMEPGRAPEPQPPPLLSQLTPQVSPCVGECMGLPQYLTPPDLGYTWGVLFEDGGLSGLGGGAPGSLRLSPRGGDFRGWGRATCLMLRNTAEVGLSNSCCPLEHAGATVACGAVGRPPLRLGGVGSAGAQGG